MLHHLRRLASGRALLSLGSCAALASSVPLPSAAQSADPWDGALETRRRLRDELLSGGCSPGEAHAALARVKLAVKGERMCATLQRSRAAPAANMRLTRCLTPLAQVLRRRQLDGSP